MGDFVDNYQLGFPSELGVLILFDPRTGAPKAILDASDITDMRTGAVTAIGAKYLARKGSKVLGHIGARGTAYWNVRLLDHLFDFDEIRIHSRREESQNAFAERLTRDLGKPVVATKDWQSCVEGADIVVEASRLLEPTPLLKTSWIKNGAFVVPYGTMSAIELSLTDIMTKLVVDDWGQCKGGKFGSLRAHVDAGKLSEKTLHAELGQIVAGLKPGRQSDAETNLFWHRGLSLSDIALGACDAGKSQAPGYRPATCASHKPAGSGHSRGNARSCSMWRMPACIRSIRGPLPPGRTCSSGFRTKAESTCGSSITRFPYRWRIFGRVPILPVVSCAAFPLYKRRIRRSRSRLRFRWRRQFRDEPVYVTRLIVAADSSFQTLEDTFGGRLGYTVDDSHSGYNALRHHLLPYRLKHGANLYRESIGPLYTPRRVIEAVLAHDIDLGPLDGFAYDLMLRHEPELAKRIRIVATTEAAPIPFLVASPQCPDGIVTSLAGSTGKFWRSRRLAPC